ncbi:MAG: hypothetical protein ACRC28_09060 [Clostridium sp.]|uniref:hypothetical protein n=1 Tax=Clostridium sp. TaxID=1506 RepID=UPI003F2B068C
MTFFEDSFVEFGIKLPTVKGDFFMLVASSNLFSSAQTAQKASLGQFFAVESTSLRTASKDTRELDIAGLRVYLLFKDLYPL